MESASNVIWIDQYINSKENAKFRLILESLGNFNIKYFKDVNESMPHLKSIKYEETFIIISGRLYPELIGNIIKNFSYLYIIPKIIVFTSDKNKGNIEKLSEELNNGNFFHFGGIYTVFNSIKEFIKKSSKKNDAYLNEENKNIFFEQIDKEEKLLLPLLYKMLIQTPSNDNIKKLNEGISNNYGQKNKDSKENQILFNSVKNIDNIPLELLSKYYSKIYKDTDLLFKENSNEYLTYTKVLYEGIKLKTLPLTSSNVLYKGCFLTKQLLDKIDNAIKKNTDLPEGILFSKKFLTFCKDKFIANNILNINKNDNLNYVLFILENANNNDYSLSTHIDFEREVLFLPFSAFEIKDIQKIDNNKYEIKLSYLGKYLDNFVKDESISNNNIPESDFKREITKFGLINNQNINIKKLLEIYAKYKLNYKDNYLNYQKVQKQLNEKYNIKNNFIIGEINVDEDGQEIRIINSCNFGDKINKEEIEGAKITIDGKTLDKFSYFYKFKQKGIYNIKYEFKKNLEKVCYMFSKCEALTYLDLSNLNSDSITDMSSMFSGCKFLKTIIFYEFNTHNVTDMSYLFSGCKSLENIDLSDFCSDKVTNMNNMFFGCEILRNIDLSNIKNTTKLMDISSMFSGCESLTNINISKLNTENVTDMSYMFFGCKSLSNINLNHLNTKNVTDMSWMFSGCESLIDINLSNFKSKNINDISSMFAGCKKLMNVNLSNLYTKDDTNMCCIFNGCKELNKVNISLFNTINEVNLFSMFSEAKPLIECNSIAAKNVMIKEL